MNHACILKIKPQLLMHWMRKRERQRNTHMHTSTHIESKINSKVSLLFSFLVCSFCFAFCSFEPLEDSHCCLTSWGRFSIISSQSMNSSVCTRLCSIFYANWTMKKKPYSGSYFFFSLSVSWNFPQIIVHKGIALILLAVQT